MKDNILIGNKHMEWFPTSYVFLGNFKLNQQWDNTTYLLGWLNPEALTIPNAGKDVEQLELSLFNGENTKWYSGTGALEDNLTVLYKTKHTHNIIQQSSAHFVFTQMSSYFMSTHKNLHMDVYNNLIHDYQHVEAALVSYSRWMDT